MHILIVTQYFYPENFKSNDLAFELSNRGYKVTVLTGLPNYPEGKIYKGYGVFKKRKEIIKGVKVIRVLVFPRGDGGALKLFLNYFSFAFFGMIKACFLSLKKKYDAVIVHEPSPITQYYPALLINKFRQVPVYFWVMDLWPESLIASGGIKNKLIIGFFERMVIRFYKNSKKILITSKGFEKAILKKGDFKDKISFFPNWAEDKIGEGNLDYSLPDLPDGFKVLFAGNLGESQDMESIMKSALLLKEEKHIKFILVGEGRKSHFLKNYIEENCLTETVFLLGKYPIDAMAAFFNKANVLLVSLKDEPIFSLTIPAKIQAYMSSKKPIIAMLNGEGAEILEEANCGVSVPAGNYEALSRVLINMSSKEPEALRLLGVNGYNFYMKNYKLENCISNLENILNEEKNIDNRN